MRNTLYYKDDDFRLSLLYGNYVTLTNLSDDDIERIIKLKISPLNFSVHTTDPDLRVKMMGNPKAGRIFELLKRFADAQINMRCQIVLCKGINDGINLEKTMKDLKSLHPCISSVSIVPVGLTKYREGLYPLEPFNEEDSKKVIEQVNDFGDKTKDTLGSRLFYVADEFYIKAGIPLPGYAYYEEFEQIENGVGMMISFAQEFKDLMSSFRGNDKEINISIATGVSAKPLFETIINGLKKRLTNLKCSIYPIRNDFFGENITVTGLITGTDLINQLKDKQLGNYLLISASMLRDDKFLDDVTVKDAEKALKIKIKKVAPSAEELVNTIMKSGNTKK
jgi:putative radical SAM enzyme (TIGR03279 family)